MMGGGFGGCTINMIKKDAVTNYAEKTAAAYLEKFERNCSVYEVSLSQGTHLI
jgi:galactokinase